MEGRRPRERQSQTGALLLNLLEGAYGTPDTAKSTLRLALARAGLAGVPDTPIEALLFVRAYLLGRLSAEVGPRLAMALVDELVVRLEEPPDSGVVISAPPPSSASRIARLSVCPIRPPASRILLIVDADALRRASLARLLVPARWDVRTADSHEHVLDAVSEDEHPGVIVVAMEHFSVEAIVYTAVANWPDAAIVLHGDLPQTTARLLELRQVRACSRGESLLDRIHTFVAESRKQE